MHSITAFEQVKQAITIPQAAERYGLTYDGHGKMRCPFHDDHTPSLQLNDTYFYCYGCGAHGDVTDFTANLFGLQPWQAARKLLDDFGLQLDMTPVPRQITMNKAQTFHEQESLCFSAVTAYRRLLTWYEQKYRPQNPGDPIDPRFREALSMKATVNHWLDDLLGPQWLSERCVKALMRSYDMAEFRKTILQKTEEENIDVRI